MIIASAAADLLQRTEIREIALYPLDVEVLFQLAQMATPKPVSRFEQILADAKNTARTPP